MWAELHTSNAHIIKHMNISHKLSSPSAHHDIRAEIEINICAHRT